MRNIVIYRSSICVTKELGEYSKRGVGVKDFLNSVQKNCNIGQGWLPNND